MSLSCADPSFFLRFFLQEQKKKTNSSNTDTFHHLRTKTIPSCIRTQDSFVYDLRYLRVTTLAVIPKARSVPHDA